MNHFSPPPHEKPCSSWKTQFLLSKEKKLWIIWWSLWVIMKEGYTLSHVQRNYRVKHSGKLWHLLLQKKYSEGRKKGGVEFSQGLSVQASARMHFCTRLYLYISLAVLPIRCPFSPCVLVHRAIWIFTSTNHKGKSGEDIRFFNPEATNYQSN